MTICIPLKEHLNITVLRSHFTENEPTEAGRHMRCACGNRFPISMAQWLQNKTILGINVRIFYTAIYWWSVQCWVNMQNFTPTGFLQETSRRYGLVRNGGVYNDCPEKYKASSQKSHHEMKMWLAVGKEDLHFSSNHSKFARSDVRWEQKIASWGTR